MADDWDEIFADLYFIEESGEEVRAKMKQARPLVYQYIVSRYTKDDFVKIFSSYQSFQNFCDDIEYYMKTCYK